MLEKSHPKIHWFIFIQDTHAGEAGRAGGGQAPSEGDISYLKLLLPKSSLCLKKIVKDEAVDRNKNLKLWNKTASSQNSSESGME